MSKTLNILAAIAIFLTLIAITVGVFFFKKYSEDLPDYQQLKDYTPMITTRIYDADGSLITEFSKEKRIFVPIEIIPKNLINAFLAAEDSNFYSHSGIDPIAIVRTSVRNLFSMMSGSPRMGGASTITQQVVKNFLLTRERTLQRKIKEAILAFRMTQSFTKDQVLELYLNQIYLGSGAYGVAAAAQAYFNKSIDNLEIEEVALLATLPKAPSKLDPRKNIEKAKIRRDWVISRMIDEDFITREDGKAAMEKPIILNEKTDEEVTKAEFFGDAVKKELTEMYGSDDVFENGIVVRTTLDPRLQELAQKALEKGIENYDMKHGYRGRLGKINLTEENWEEKLKEFEIKDLYKPSWKKAVVLKVKRKETEIGLESGELGLISIKTLQWAKKYYSVDSRGPTPRRISNVLKAGDIILVEKKASLEPKDQEEEISEYLLRQLPEVNGAFVVIDPHSGRVLAMSGGYIDAPNQFNRATQAMRQPGSTIKTFGYIAALESGLTPASIIMDEEISLNQGEDLPPYKPANYSEKFYGPTTLRTGIEKSRNVTTVRMADQIGLDKIVEVVKKFGVNEDPKSIYSLVLGSTETSPMRLATAYAMMVNGGKKITPAIIEKIQDRDGKTIFKRDGRSCKYCEVNDLNQYVEKDIEELPVPFLDESAEYITDSATAFQITSMLQGVVDRGTGVRARSVGKIIGGKTGTTNNSYDSWFVGFSPDLVATVYVGFDIPKTLGKYETGASVALPIFAEFMKEALEETPSTPFRVPNTIKFVKIDRTTGKIATPSTPRENIFFEAFKLSDKIEDYADRGFFEEKIEDADFDDGYSDSTEPMGIY